eukprot:TRINITY_DN3114_c0_g1_i3.p1 TRINITY_DN3114_c0_g1~~TRINITY_DN3114_c0_g1_i3.p1  ORF type:complete len:134 (-),score=30.15 TRINITY_DN3114_c0_g1_i3:185-550(-)
MARAETDYDCRVAVEELQEKGKRGSRRRKAEWKEKRDMEELKGFIELGFDFSNPEELSSRVKEVVPALKTLSSPPRFEQQHSTSHSGIPCRTSDDALVKTYLKKWARFVALKAASTALSVP